MNPLPSAAAILAAGRAHGCPPPLRPWLGRQSWQHMMLAHWPVAAEQIQAVLPRGVTVDTLDGTAWVSVVAYRMAHVRLRGMPNAFGLTFPQLNLRTYVRINDKPGIYFFSLDASSPLAVHTGSWVTGLPYHVARMQQVTHADVTHFSSQREGPGPSLEATYTPGATLEAPSELDHWLTERYVFFANAANGTLRMGAVCHGPWPLARVEATIVKNTLADAWGLDLSRAPHHLQYSKGVDVLFWRPQAL